MIITLMSLHVHSCECVVPPLGNSYQAAALLGTHINTPTHIQTRNVYLAASHTDQLKHWKEWVRTLYISTFQLPLHDQ